MGCLMQGKCAYGCGNPAKFFNKQTGQGRCEELVGNCPAIKAKKKAAYEVKASEKRAALEAILANPQPCECNAPGLFYSERSKRWRCSEMVGNCPAHKAKREAKVLELYGTTVIAHIPGVQITRKQTLIANHAKRSPEEKERIKEKRESTMIARHGVRNAGQSKVLREKREETTLERYGKQHTLQVEQFRQNGLDNYKDKTGFDHWSHNPSTIEKKISSMLERYGVEYPYKNPEIYEKQKATMMELYGIENAMHSSELFERSKKNAFKAKSYEMPSGTILSVQGYEPFALDYLLHLGWKEIQLTVESGKMPQLTYYIGENIHRYHPDIFIPSKNHVIEVKSVWTLYSGDSMNYTKNIAKMESAKLVGYQFSCLVFDHTGTLVEIIGDSVLLH